MAKLPKLTLDDAWLNLTEQDFEDFKNPLMTAIDNNRPAFSIVKVMMNPDYFWWTAKILFGINILPAQAAILKELWSRPFPMYIASRGFGKALEPNTPVRVQNGWRPIKDLEVGDMVYGSDGKLTKVISTTRKQTNLKFYRVTLRDGRQINCCEDHMWKVWDKNKNRGEEVIWSELSTKDMVNNYFYVRKDSKSSIPKETKEYRYALPINKAIDDDEKEFRLHPYVLGVLLGDGCMTQKTISITSKDPEIIEKFRRHLKRGYKIEKIESSDITYTITKDKDDPISKIMPPFYKQLEMLGLWGCNSHTKFIPYEYQFGSIEQREELIRGLMDTDGYAKESVIEYYTVSDRLSRDFLDVVRSLGIHCKHSLKESWFEGNRYADCNRISLYTKQEVFSLKRKLDAYINHPISKQGQSKYEKVFITSIEEIGTRDGYCFPVTIRSAPTITILVPGTKISLSIA